MTLVNEGFFWVTLGGIVVTITGLCLKALFRVKVSDVSICFGCCNITRDVQTEQEIEEARIENGVAESSENTPREEKPAQKRGFLIRGFSSRF